MREHPPKLENIKEPKKEKSKQEEFDKFLVPEEWPEDVIEAQKDAYRMKVLAFFEKTMEESKIATLLDPFKSKIREKTSVDPLTEDYKSAELLYQQIYGSFPAENKTDKAINKMLELTGGIWLKAYVELRARMLARSESKKLEEGPHHYRLILQGHTR